MAHPPREAVCARGNRGPAHQNCESCFLYCFPFVDAPACSCLRQYRSRTGRSRLFSQRCSSSSVSGCTKSNPSRVHRGGGGVEKSEEPNERFLRLRLSSRASISC